METSVIIITIGFFIFCGHFLSGVFERRSIPDVLGLMFLGILLGPVFHIVNPDSFGQFGSLFSNFVLVFILHFHIRRNIRPNRNFTNRLDNKSTYSVLD